MIAIESSWLFSTQNIRKGGFDSYLKQEFRKWVLEKNGSLQPRVGEEKEDEGDGLVSLLVLNAPQALSLSQYVMKKKRRKESIVRKREEEKGFANEHG